MTAATALIAFVALQRLGELVFAARNSQGLLSRGAVEVGRSDLPLIVAVHACWLAGLFLLGRDRAVNPGWFGLFVAVEAARLWVMATLGRRWTVRVLVVPGERLVRRGPYRLLRHPNYLVVALEIAIVPLALGMPVFAAVFSILNAAVLYRRIRVENFALAGIAEPAGVRTPTARPPTLANGAGRL